MGAVTVSKLETLMGLVSLLWAGAVAMGCSACSEPSDGDAEADADTVTDADEHVADTDPDDGRQGDADEHDVDVRNPFDADCSAAPDGDGVLMDIIEVTTSTEGRECGQGCRQVTFEAPIVHGAHFIANGDYLVYFGDVGDRPIFIVDLITQREFILDDDPDYQRGFFDIESNFIAYVTGSWTSTDLNMTLWRYHIGECARYPLVTREMTALGRPMHGITISGDMVAWRDSAIDGAGLYAMSLDGGDVIDLTPNHCICYGDPILVGRTVLFEGWHSGPRDIWVVDIDTQVQTNLTNLDYPQFEPAFDGQWAIWTDGRNDPTPSPYSTRFNSDIYGMRMPDGSHEALCTDPSTQLHPAVNDGLVAWEDFRNSPNPNDAWDREANIDIYLLDLATRREIQATSLPGQERYPQIDGGRLFFVSEDDNGEPAVFMIDLEEAGLI